MRPKSNETAFDEMQRALLVEMIRTTRRVLETKRLSKARVRDITEDLIFHLSVLLDGDADVPLEGRAVVPQLTFRGKRRGSSVTAKGGSWMHEYAFGCVSEVFETDGSAGGGVTTKRTVGKG